MNKRIMKKGLAIVLALVMVFAMTATAFAADSGVNVTVKMYGQTYITDTISAAEISARAGSASHLYSTTGASASVPNVGYTAADALIEAWYQKYNLSSYSDDQILIGWDNNPAVGAPGLYFTTYDGMSSDAGSYYYVGPTTDGKYEYYWRGDSWTLYIDNTNPADLYASSYGIATTSSIVFDYNSVKSDNFTLDYLIPNCPNASEDPYN